MLIHFLQSRKSIFLLILNEMKTFLWLLKVLQAPSTVPIAPKKEVKPWWYHSLILNFLF